MYQIMVCSLHQNHHYELDFRAQKIGTWIVKKYLFFTLASSYSRNDRSMVCKFSQISSASCITLFLVLVDSSVSLNEVPAPLRFGDFLLSCKLRKGHNKILKIVKKIKFLWQYYFSIFPNYTLPLSSSSVFSMTRWAASPAWISFLSGLSELILIWGASVVMPLGTRTEINYHLYLILYIIWINKFIVFCDSVSRALNNVTFIRTFTVNLKKLYVKN